jgi:hypothetical protein
MPPSPEEIQRLNREFNDVDARGATELRAAEDARRAALLVVPGGREIVERYEEAVTRAETTAWTARRDADAARETREVQARQTRAIEEDTAYASYLANDAEAIRTSARQRADEECSNRMSDVGRRIPPVGGATLDAERRSAFEVRDAAHRAADEAYEVSVNAARDALGAAQQKAYWKYVNAAEDAAVQHQQALTDIDRTFQEALTEADEAFANAVRSIPAAAAIEQTYSSTRYEIEQRCEAQKQQIYRQLRGEPS